MDETKAPEIETEGAVETAPISLHINPPSETTPKVKKVLYVITKANWGGAQRYVFDLALASKAQGHDVGVAFGEPGLLTEKLTASDVRTIPLPTLTRDINLKSEWESLKELKRIITEERPDILHVNSSKAGLAIVAGRLAKVPRILFTAHGFAFNENRPWWQGLILRVIYAVTVLLAHKTICVSDAIHRDISFVPFLDRKLVVIKNGIDAPTFLSRAEARKRLPKTEKRVWLGMLTELHPTKRVIDAVYALAELKEQYPDVALFVLGEGSEREHLEEVIARLGMNDCVFLAGFVPDASTYLHAFDIFLIPSRTEALAYALIEAGYAGLPSIASRVGGMREIVRHKDTGLLTPPENPHTLARAIRIFLDDPAYAKQLGEKLKITTTERFNKEKMIEETLALYV